MIAVDDIGKFGAAAFTRHDGAERARSSTSPATRSPCPRRPRSSAEALGRKVEFQRIPIEQVRKNSEDFALMLEWFDRVGYDADIAGIEKKYGPHHDPPSALGRRARPTAEVARVLATSNRKPPLRA